MNFNFNNHRTKFHLGQPLMRQFSSIGLVTIKPDQNDYNLKQDFGFQRHNILQNFGGSVVTNKSFSNPNFVNKENPHILTNINGAVNFDKQKFVEYVTPHLFIQQPKHLNCNNTKFDEKSVACQPTSDKLSSQSGTQNIGNTSEMPAPIFTELPVKRIKKKRNKKNRKSSKFLRQDLVPAEPNLMIPKVNVMSKKYKSHCSAPKKIKKEPEVKIRCRGKSKKNNKPWHKMSLDMEIMECDEPTVSTPQIDVLSNGQICPKSKSCPIEIISSKCKNIISEALSLSLSPCTDILKNLSTSNTSASDICSMSPSSPVIRRLRFPSECDSEDSFIVFCDDTNSEMTEEESSAEGLSDSDFDFDITDFQEKTDLNKGYVKKKVTFRCDPELCEVHPMIQWGFAYQNARKGPWEQIARDRTRFESRISRTETEISSILDPCHRDRIYRERFEES